MRVVSRRRIKEYAPFEQRAVDVADHRADVAAGVPFAERSGSQPIKILAITRRKAVAVRLVHRVVLSLRRHYDVLVAQHVRPYRWIKREAVDAVADAVDEHRGGAVD